jgi:ribosomal protein RSM22 (predicted rRNA methylase)
MKTNIEKKLQELLEDEAELTEYAYKRTESLLKELAQIYEKELPHFSLNVTDRGGVDIVWDKLSTNKKRISRLWVHVAHNEQVVDSIYYIDDLREELSHFIQGCEVKAYSIWYILRKRMGF